MGYELQLFRGDDPGDDASFEPLDRERVGDLLLELDGTADLGSEIAWPREWLVASVLLSSDRDHALRSLYVSVEAQDAGGGENPPEDARWDFRRLLEQLLEVADDQDARLYDRQLEQDLDEESVDEAVAVFARSAA